MPEAPISVVGLIGGECFGAAARAAIEDATVVVGSDRHLSGLDGFWRRESSINRQSRRQNQEEVVLAGGLDGVLDAVEERRNAGERVCVLASGDPGFFGIVRVLGERFGPGALAIHPAPSAIAMAFARLGTSWDDARVVSAHGRPLADAVARLVTADKAAVLCSPDNPPEAIAAALIEAGRISTRAAVVTRVGEPGEAMCDGDLGAIAAGKFDPMSILVLLEREPGSASLAWGLPEHEFAHRDGMITKAEVRAVALGKLALPRSGVLWDIGAGSGSVAIEAARLCPDLRVLAIEHDADSAARIEENARAHDVSIEVVRGSAPSALADLPDPDRVFVGGGGIEALDEAVGRLRPSGVVVANYAVLDRAVLAWQRLGNLVELSVARGVRTGDVGVRLAAENPVFVCWGPS